MSLPPRTMREKEDLYDAVENLLDFAYRSMYDRRSEETFKECQLCGDVDGHLTECPIPLLEKWQLQPERIR
jgi:hypothetical protein